MKASAMTIILFRIGNGTRKHKFDFHFFRAKAEHNILFSLKSLSKESTSDMLFIVDISLKKRSVHMVSCLSQVFNLKFSGGEIAQA